MPGPLLFITGEYPPDIGGVADYTARLRSALSERGWSSSALSRHDVRRWDARALVQLLRRAPGAGLVHIQYQPAAFDLLGDVCLMPWLLRRFRPRVRVVTTFHDVRVPYLFPRAGQRLRWRAVDWLARSSHAVMAADARDLLRLGAPSPRHHLVPIGSNIACRPPPAYDRQAWRARLGLAPQALAVVYFGLLNASKGVRVLLEAMALIVKDRPDARLLLVGGSPGASDPTNRATMRAFDLAAQALAGSVTRTGHLWEAELSATLLAGDVALLPYADGASARRGSLLACAAHGLPIVSTQPTSGLVADAVLGVPPTDVPALAEAVLQVASDPRLAARLRQASARLTAATSWPRIADAHIQIYEQLLAT